MDSETSIQYIGVLLGLNALIEKYKRKCPNCGTLIYPTDVPPLKNGGVPCPACGQRLRPSLRHSGLSCVIALAISFGLCSFAGLREPWTILISVALTLPLTIVIHAVVSATFPPPFEMFPIPKDHSDSENLASK